MVKKSKSSFYKDQFLSFSSHSSLSFSVAHSRLLSSSLPLPLLREFQSQINSKPLTQIQFQSEQRNREHKSYKRILFIWGKGSISSPWILRLLAILDDWWWGFIVWCMIEIYCEEINENMVKNDVYYDDYFVFIAALDVGGLIIDEYCLFWVVFDVGKLRRWKFTRLKL